MSATEIPDTRPRHAGTVDLLYAARHGQSTTNAGLRPATPADADDMAIALTDLGASQAAALGVRLAALAPDRRPDWVLCSPYPRARRTWRIAEEQLAAAGVPLPDVETDPRLYDRFRGDHSHLPASVVRANHPEEAAAEAADPLGYRPPGGESFRDVADRLRAVVDRVDRDTRHRTVLIMAHDAVVLMLRHLLEHHSDAEILAIAADGLAGNASLTSWSRTESGFRLLAYDDRAHLD
ncbi:histidine phosphatase family protein [Nocardia takedensis]|uniref:histidine phosphatase family protein n=1 Tax=Nocardia takedensis TaxID=259390 RepID=UPI0002F99C3E|nr:histidine phosphatase family protein [Nocardia takedensis]